MSIIEVEGYTRNAETGSESNTSTHDLYARFALSATADPANPPNGLFVPSTSTSAYTCAYNRARLYYGGDEGWPNTCPSPPFTWTGSPHTHAAVGLRAWADSVGLLSGHFGGLSYFQHALQASYDLFPYHDFGEGTPSDGSGFVWWHEPGDPLPGPSSGAYDYAAASNIEIAPGIPMWNHEYEIVRDTATVESVTLSVWLAASDITVKVYLALGGLVTRSSIEDSTSADLVSGMTLVGTYGANASDEQHDIVVDPELVEAAIAAGPSDCKLHAVAVTQEMLDDVQLGPPSSLPPDTEWTEDHTRGLSLRFNAIVRSPDYIVTIDEAELESSDDDGPGFEWLTPNAAGGEPRARLHFTPLQGSPINGRVLTGVGDAVYVPPSESSDDGGISG